MGFYDNPNVDISSQVSEESVLATKQAFLQKNGFLVREENPDKGVDLDVEMIINNKVSGFKFAIQIKSAQNLQTVQKDNISYISYSIKTSRLGYLCRRSPGFGLIVVFDEHSHQLYYDFIENIFSRITKSHNNDEWMKNETVTFHIETSNIIDPDSLILIYQKMNQRCTNFNDMYAQKASDFDLPTFEHSEFKDPVVVLEKYGYIFFNNNDYRIIYDLLSRMSLNKILTNHKLLLLSALTYYRIGQYVESDYFLRKCDFYLNEYNDTERELLHISKFSSDFALGKISRSQYYMMMKEFGAAVKGALNLIYIHLQTLFVELLDTSIYDETSFEHVFSNIEDIQERINRLDVAEDIKYLYMLDVLSLIHEIGIRQFSKFEARMMIQKRLLGDSPLQERVTNAKLLAILLLKTQERLQFIWTYSNKSDNAYLQAMVLFKKTYMFYSFTVQRLISSYANRDGMGSFKETCSAELFVQAYSDIIKAYTVFKERRDLHHAYRCLSISLEINYLFSFLQSKNIDDNLYKQALLALGDLEKELHLGPYRILTEEMLIDLVSRKERHGSAWDEYSFQSSDEKYRLANLIVQSIGLPVERIDNLISEMTFMQQAREVINAKYFDILQNLSHTKSKDTFYKEAPLYIIRCKKCNYQTVESDNLNTLLACLRAEHSHYCL